MSKTKREIERLKQEGIDILHPDDDLDDEFWYEVYLREDAKKFNQYKKDEQTGERRPSDGNSKL